MVCVAGSRFGACEGLSGWTDRLWWRKTRDSGGAEVRSAVGGCDGSCELRILEYERSVVARRCRAVEDNFSQFAMAEEALYQQRQMGRMSTRG